ncbi:metal-dependent hydrolase [Chloroflexota bacterium]
MLVFGHTGITLGVAIFLAGVLRRNRLPVTIESEAEEPSSGHSRLVANRKASGLTHLINLIDTRLILIGALLPDIIDKPVGQFFFRETFNNGRIFGHTLIFLIMVTAVGIYLYRRNSRTWLLTLSFGTITHLLLDQMWLNSKTLFWPLLGLSFERGEVDNYVLSIFQTLLTNPIVYITELVGLAVLIWFFWTIFRRRKIYSLIKYGKV